MLEAIRARRAELDRRGRAGRRELHAADLLGELQVDVELPPEALIESVRAIEVGDGNRRDLELAAFFHLAGSPRAYGASRHVMAGNRQPLGGPPPSDGPSSAAMLGAMLLRTFTRRLTYADVASSLCLFVVLGGSAYAATSI